MVTDQVIIRPREKAEEKWFDSVMAEAPQGESPRRDTDTSRSWESGQDLNKRQKRTREMVQWVTCCASMKA